MHTSLKYVLFPAILGLAMLTIAPANAQYAAQALTQANDFGSFYPVAIENGVAIGTLDFSGNGGDLALSTNGSTQSAFDYCRPLGFSDATVVEGASPDAAMRFRVGICKSVAVGYVADSKANTTAKLVYPRATTTVPTAASAAGLVAGYYEIGSSAPIHGFYLVGNIFSSFDPPGSVETVPTGITSTTTIFGWYYDAALKTHGFLMNQYGSYTGITFPFGITTILLGANSQNQAVGYYIVNNFQQNAFLWENGNFLAPPLPANTNSAITAIKDNGVAAGYYTDLSGVDHGFVWQTSTNAILYFNAPAGTTGLQVLAASNTDDSVTGWCMTASGAVEGFIARCTGAACF
jgi:hypothetical protein